MNLDRLNLIVNHAKFEKERLENLSNLRLEECEDQLSEEGKSLLYLTELIAAINGDDEFFDKLCPTPSSATPNGRPSSGKDVNGKAERS
jgi:hypothetical protein